MKTRILGLALVVVVLFGLCFSGAAQVPKDKLIIGMDTGAIVDFAPARVYELEGAFVLEQTYDNLVDYIGDFKEIEPGLAKSWSRSEDGLTWTFNIRKNATFHSGNPVNADAVVFSLRRSLKRGLAPSWILSQFVPKPDMIEKSGPYTVKITTNQPLSEHLMGSIFSFQGINAILDPEVVKEHATEDDPFAAQWLASHDAGSGPYKLKEWKRNKRIVLERFDDYWRNTPAIEEVVIKSIPETSTQKMMVGKGTIDIAWNLLPNQINTIKDNPNIKIQSIPSFTFRYIGMNASFEPFSHEKVRDAVRWSIDYETIVENIVGGAGSVSQVFVPKGMFGHLDENPYHQDLEKAKNLLKEAGYGDGFEVDLMVIPRTPYTNIAALLKSWLGEIGVTVNVRQIQYSQILEKYRDQGHEMVLVRWGTDYPDPDALAKPFAHCRTTGPEASVRQLAWRNMYVNEEATDLVEKAVGLADREERLEMYKKIQRIILDKGPFAILFNPVTQISVRTNVKGMTLFPMWFYTDLSLVEKE